MGRELRKDNGKLNGSRPKAAPTINKALCAHPNCSSTRLWKKSGVCKKHLDWARWSLPSEKPSPETLDLNAVDGALDLGVVEKGRKCSRQGCNNLVDEDRVQGTTGHRCRSCYNKELNETLEVNKSEEFRNAENQKQVLIDFYKKGMRSTRRKTEPAGVGMFRRYLETTAYREPEQAAVYANRVDAIYTTPQGRGRVELICTPTNGDAPHTYDGRISMSYKRLQKEAGNHRVCDDHIVGSGGYTTQKPGWLYLLQRPSMNGPQEPAYKTNGDYYYDYQYGISNVPRDRLHNHITSSGWEVVELRRNDDGKLALALETMVSRARSKNGFEYYALDKNDRPMTGRTESFKEEDFGKPVKTLYQLIQWAAKETGEYETAQYFSQMERASKDEVRELLKRRDS